MKCVFLQCFRFDSLSYQFWGTDLVFSKEKKNTFFATRLSWSSDVSLRSKSVFLSRSKVQPTVAKFGGLIRTKLFKAITLREMIFVQPYFNNFCNNPISHTHMYFYSFSSSFSLYYFYPIRRKKKWLPQKLFAFGCTNITPLTLNGALKIE